MRIEDEILARARMDVALTLDAIDAGTHDSAARAKATLERMALVLSGMSWHADWPTEVH